MRMWMIDPKLLCRKHLIGEHGEIHKHRHCFEKQYSISRRVSPVVQIEPESMQSRHDALADEMARRGYNHGSPYTAPIIEYLPERERRAKVDTAVSLIDLAARCADCRERIKEGGR